MLAHATTLRPQASVGISSCPVTAAVISAARRSLESSMRHPSRAAYAWPLQEFDVEDYLRSIRGR
jgi:hypothetical protein